jgi:RecA DNA recombination protein
MGKHLARLRKLEGAVNAGDGEVALLDCLRTPSPSVNWSFAMPGFGQPRGTGRLLYGPPKGGKSVFTLAEVGQIHADDPDAIVIKFDTELRGKFQNNLSNLTKFGIDPERYIIYDANQPEHIFDRIEHDIAAACQDGEKIVAIYIDSLSGIMGRRTLNADTISTQQIGDQAATIKDGLLRILPVIRKYNIALTCTAHVRAEMDMKEQMRGKTIKMQAAWATKHIFEFFCYVEPNKSKDGKVNLAGEEFTDASVLDFMDKSAKTGHKIRYRVEESSFPYGGRTAEFTLDFEKGIINQYEEIFTLAVNYGFIQRPNNVTYIIGENNYKGVVACLTAVRDNPALQVELLDKIKKADFNKLKGIKTTEG